MSAPTTEAERIHTAAAGPPRRRRTRLRKAGVVVLFLAPSFVPLAMFTLAPMIGSLWVALHDWNLISPMRWVGADNFRELATDSNTWRAFGNTLYYIAGYLPLVFAGGLTAALALNTALRGRNVFRAAFFLPVVTSWVVVALVWKWLLNPSNGVVNHMLGLIGIDGPGWWTDPTWAMPSVILASAWKDVGFVMVILLAGLQAIPAEYYDAARVDGASAWQRFRHVTLPLLSPSSFFVVVISMINGFQVFDQVFVMTGGGPAGSTEVVVQQIYDLTFRYGRAGDASALSWLLFAVILVVTVIQVRIQRRWVTYA
ncbi:carbohydrate ABC transporter permease [Phytoactinopolyspora mesophila]|uniref:ABC transporter permease subunit n=1 Tax=Phytoactinopolyspora mesophila TaxID=2650750 RepID=A0A7K3MBR7_9ACTN|nr:sugar ABC transporter permease [Phytoactinopolyspora mesophila]NDL60743.1 ABC transporter permease subunit [Phytoactinopolyspora mesophila]